MSKALNVCLVGFGRAGQFHFRSVDVLPQFELRYIVDPGRNKADQDVPEGCQFMDQLEPALEDEQLDVVIVASPTGFHHEQIKQALEAGKHVFTEKPVGKTVDDILDCFSLARDHQLTFHLGFQRRYDINFRHLKDQLQAIGQPRILRTSSRDNPKPSLDYLSISGNIFHDMLIHDFDMLIYLMGSRIPKTIFSMAHAYDEEIAQLKDFDTVMVNIEYEDGLICTIDTSRTSPYGYDQRIEVFGADGMLMAENEQEHSVKLMTDQGIRSSRILHSFPQRYRDCYQRELEHFYQHILEGKQFNIESKECVLAHLMADAAHQSAVEKKPIDFKGFHRDHAGS